MEHTGRTYVVNPTSFDFVQKPLGFDVIQTPEIKPCTVYVFRLDSVPPAQTKNTMKVDFMFLFAPKQLVK